MLSIGSLMMIMPLGPDFVRELDMPADRIGYLAGAATLAAALGSALSAAWLDRFERKPVLLALLALLVLRFALLGACAGASDAHQLTWLFVLSAFIAGPGLPKGLDGLIACSRGKRGPWGVGPRPQR